MKKDVDLGKLWRSAANDATRGVGSVLNLGCQAFDYFTSNKTYPVTLLKSTTPSTKSKRGSAAVEKKQCRLDALRKEIVVTDQNAIPDRPKTRFLGYVACDSNFKDDVDAWLNFFANVKQLGGGAVINLRVYRSAGGYIHIKGDALAP